ncbi:hypothetical protein GCM10008171_23940 [Methylopila jiangsuensis]|uniref:Uncharacterized protein n=1 Tax=Methylopila jiangsuensis TaxID=586230 RepID=A0A9W6N4A7_9HYPH|nr:glycosyltransferase [Methylopila jiangsuensis]MDR6286520.1 hypothetical protein [Methylopila jiangsuensis]GLK77140.1 hypothetical protein GCM10008171_23940 [Methylopila jiangsuensis]
MAVALGGLLRGLSRTLNELRRLRPLAWPATDRVYLGDLTVRDPRRYAVVTTITDNFIGMGAAFLLSLHERLGRRDEVDVILLQSPGVAPLSLENGIALQELCPGLKIIEVDTSSFLTAANMTRYDKEGRPMSRRRDHYELPSKKAAYVKLNVLRLAQYEKVVLMDSDMLVVDDFSDVFDLSHDIAAVRTGAPDPDFTPEHRGRGAPRIGFNTGFVAFDQAALGAGAFNTAIDFMELRRNRRLRDQSILNEIFAHADRLYLPHAYNYKIHVSDPERLSRAETLERVKVLHFVATTKWGLKDPANSGKPIYDYYHAVQKRTGIPFILEP